MLKVAIFGATGQVGLSLADTFPSSTDAVFINRTVCDLSDDQAILQTLNQCQADVVINAAAYTQVDKAESEPELAYQINAGAPMKMATWVRDNGAKLIHISTDFVFDGQGNKPYQTNDQTGPLGIYGKSKWLGEEVVQAFSNQQAMIIRTAWVYSEHGGNFVKTMLRLMAEKDGLSVVNDQRGSPTYARGIAEMLWQVVEQDQLAPGIFHWTDAGEITWYDFAVAIQEEALKLGLLEKQIPLNPIPSSDYPTPAARPGYSVLDCSLLSSQMNRNQIPWRENLRKMLTTLAEQS